MSDPNLHNQSVYSTAKSASVADFLVANHAIQSALKFWLELLVPSPQIRLLELGAGKRPDRWRVIASLPTDRHWHVTLSDFTYAALPSQATLPHHRQFAFRLAKLDLLTDPFPRHPVDAVLATYVFDSIWFPQDQYLNQMHYPGGLIHKVRSAFASCLAPTGVFISLDKTSTRFVPEFEYSGSARFKTQNYQLAQQTLRKLGFQADLYSLNDFVSQANLSLPLDLSDHSALIVTRPPNHES